VNSWYILYESVTQDLIVSWILVKLKSRIPVVFQKQLSHKISKIGLQFWAVLAIGGKKG
jgi:hypothetical protein